MRQHGYSALVDSKERYGSAPTTDHLFDHGKLTKPGGWGADFGSNHADLFVGGDGHVWRVAPTTACSGSCPTACSSGLPVQHFSTVTACGME